MAPPRSPREAAFWRLLDFFNTNSLPASPTECVEFAPINKDVPCLVFTPAAPAPPTADSRDLPQADDTHLSSCLDLGASYIQANAARFPGDQPMAPWESADLFMEAGQAVFKTYALPGTAWTPRRPYQEEDIYECTLHHNDENPRRPWETTTLICDDSHCIRGCIIADWSAPLDEPSPSGTILQSELVTGAVLLLRLLFLDYWPLAQSFITDNKLEIRLITFTRSSVRAVNVGLSLSTTAETTISFALQDLPPLYIEDAETTTSWQPFLSWALGSHGESQRHRGDRSPDWENGTQFAIRGRMGRRTADGEYEHKPQDWAGAGRSCSVSDSVDWAEDNPGSRVPSKTELELSRLRGEE